MIEDRLLDFKELASKYGKFVEDFDVTTADGYILKVFHIPGDRRRPVFLIHGLGDSADTFIVRTNKSLTFFLSNNGYDVWLGNVRGNKYSRRHLILNPDHDREFWNFSFHEMALYDLPSMIDHVLSITGQNQLSAIGHSQGNTLFYVLGAMKPEYNSKVNVLIALGPICYLNNVMFPISWFMESALLLNCLLLFLAYRKEELFNPQSVVIKGYRTFCSQKALYSLCVYGIFFALAGADPEEFSNDILQTVSGHYPSSASRKNAVHLAQIARNGTFAQFDYGSSKNLELYNSVRPPEYNLKNVRMPIALLTAKNDKLSTVKDVERLKSCLPNVVLYHEMERSRFNHIDFVWGLNMDLYLFPLVSDILKSYGNW